MTKFKFRLASVLKLRENDREQRRAELAEALQLEQELNARMENLERELAAVQAGRRAPTGTLDIDSLLDAERYRAVLRMKQLVLGEQAGKLSVEIENRRQRLVEADRNVQLLERLQESHRQQFHQEQARREIKELDEVASRRAASRDRSHSIVAAEDLT